MIVPPTLAARKGILVLALTAGALLADAAAARCQHSFTDVARRVNPKLVKLFGAGGFKGLPAYGTGILVSPQGHILTVNNHLLTSTSDLKIHLSDGRSFLVRVLSREPELDLALLKIDDDSLKDLPYFDIAEAAKRPLASAGDWIVAMSNQFHIATRDEPMSVQRGVISALTDLRGRRGDFDPPYNGEAYFLDAIACNPGAAGGVITDRKGSLLGILGRELKNRLSDTWINYAMPIQTEVEILRDDKKAKVNVATFVQESIAGKYVVSTARTKEKGPGGYHGIVLVPNVVQTTPAYVEEVVPGSPAAQAGLRPDDLIVYVEGELVPSIKAFREIIRQTRPGTVLRLEVQRGNRLQTINLKLTEHPKQKG
jgi:serine protease Do